MSINETVAVSRLTLDVLNSTAKPLTSLERFKNDILSILSVHFPDCACQFSSYIKTNNSPDCYVMSDIISKGLPDFFSTRKWVDNYFGTYIFNPNRCSPIVNSQRNTFRISDLVTPIELEQCRNYNALLKPNGYYYAVAAMLKHEGAYIGQVTLLRKKESHDFTQEEVVLFEAICPYLTARLLDYEERSGKLILQELFLASFNQNVNGMLVLDEHYNVIAGNQLGAEYCTEMFPSQPGDEYSFRQMADTVQRYHRLQIQNFQHTSAMKSREYYISVEPHIVLHGDRELTCYLVYINGCKYSVSTDKLQNNSYLSSLSPRQRDIITLMSTGLSNKEIANQLLISEHTVRKHIENIRTLLGAKNRIAVLKKLNLLA